MKDQQIVIKGNLKSANPTKRGSIYRGVSKNGKQYQVMVMNNNYKYFSGQIKSEELAARIYDRYALQTLGLRARTNFDYTRAELVQIIADIEAYMNSLPPIQNMHSGKEETIVDRRVITLKGTFLIAK